MKSMESGISHLGIDLSLYLAHLVVKNPQRAGTNPENQQRVRTARMDLASLRRLKEISPGNNIGLSGRQEEQQWTCHRYRHISIRG